MKYKFITTDLNLKALGLLALATFWGGCVYRLFGLGTFGLILSLILIITSFLILLKIERKYNRDDAEVPIRQQPLTGQSQIKFRLLTVTYLLLYFGCCYQLFISGTTRSIVSPWQVVPANFFILYFLATLVLFLLLTRRRKANFWLVGLQLFITYAVILAVYRLGFGYDYFIHQATLELIDKQGLVLPAPSYYLGQYGLLTIIHKISYLPLNWLHRLLVPLTAAVFLPNLLYRALGAYFKEKFRPFYLLFVLALPLPFLTFTTPQNFALLLLLFVILLGSSLKNYYELTLAASLTLAALVTHPIAGLPAALFILAQVIRHSGLAARAKVLSFSLVFLLSASLLPLAFYLLEKPQLNLTGWSLANILPALSLASAGADNLILNFVYFFAYNFWLLLIVLAVAGIVLARKSGRLADFSPNLVVAGGLLLAYTLTKILPFNSLIGYERDDYAERIIMVAYLLLAPPLILALGKLAGSVERQNLFFRTSWLVFGLVVICASLYLAYPRYDRYFNSRGYSVGESDILAVDWIEQNAGGDYIVLADQQVSAAALSRYGFKKYYPGDIFYYPIPTGGPLYNFYLEMVYQKPTRETMAKALKLAGAAKGYFVLNKYWTDFPKILAEAKLAAAGWREFGNGQVYVFSY